MTCLNILFIATGLFHASKQVDALSVVETVFFKEHSELFCTAVSAVRAFFKLVAVWLHPLVDTVEP